MSDAPSKIKLFESHHVRAEWDAEHEKWWFSVLDTIAILTDQPDYKKVRNYWKWLKNKLNAEGSQLVSATNQLKLVAADGKRYKTDVLDTEQVLRLIQSIPSPKAEPFKLWLAQVGAQTAKAARLQLEKSTGRKVVSPRNAKQLGTQQAPEKPLLPSAPLDAPKENDDA